MTPDADACFAALLARDNRFDGVFFAGVKTTGIYCRPVCTARIPLRQNVVFYSSAAAAEQAGLRPCLRCRPELAPGAAPVDDRGRVLAVVLRRIAAGALDGAGTVASLAGEVELSERQVRRLVVDAVGVTPLDLAQTRRLLMAKALLTDTRLPVARVATASGFSSVRRMETLFASRYGLSPSSLRRGGREAREGREGKDGKDVRDAGGAKGPSAEIVLRLGYRPPMEWPALVRFFAERAIEGLEWVSGETYTRAVGLTAADGGPRTGWFAIGPAGSGTSPPAGAQTARAELQLTVSASLENVLAELVARVRAMFDLDCRPDVIAAHFGSDSRLAPLVRSRPGLRVPGGFDGFEVLCRAILGQQVSISAARTLAARLTVRYGDALPDTVGVPHGSLGRLFPTAARLARLRPTELAGVGLPENRAATLQRLAEAAATGKLRLTAGTAPDELMEQLRRFGGIGPWTASYVAMRALRWPDAFPGTDLILKRALGMEKNPTEAKLEAASRSWSPWRAYAAAHLWAEAADAAATSKATTQLKTEPRSKSRSERPTRSRAKPPASTWAEKE